MRASEVVPIIAKEGSSCGRLKNLMALDALKLSTNKADDYRIVFNTILKKLIQAGYSNVNVIPLCIDIQCYEFLEKLLAKLSKDHRFQVFFPINDFFHVLKQYAGSVFSNYHKLFFVPLCAAIFPPSHHTGVFESPPLSQVFDICSTPKP